MEKDGSMVVKQVLPVKHIRKKLIIIVLICRTERTENMNNTNIVTTAMDSEEQFMHNPDNFLQEDKARNSELDKTANLAKRFGYTEKEFSFIKALADMQFLEDIGLDGTDGVTATWQEGWQTISSPWMDSSARFELTDIGAVNCYGETLLREWCRKANEALKDTGLRKQLKDWSERTSYVEKYPYRNPIEKFGLVW